MDIWQRLCFDKCDGSSSVTDKPSLCLLKSCVELLPWCGLNNLVVVSETLCSVWTTNYLPLKTFELAT